MATGMQSYEELSANLDEYQGQLQQVEQLLLMDPENQELQDMYNGLTEVITLTKDLLRDAREQHAAAGPAAAEAPASEAAAAAGPSSAAVAAGSLAAQQIVTPADLNAPSILPASVRDQIRKAQVKAALLGQAPLAWVVGAQVQAQYAADGQLYDATVESVTESGTLVVVFDGYGNREEVTLAAVRLKPETAEIYTGVAAPKRKRVEEQPVVTEIPKWLEVKEGDDEKTVARKKKLLKSYKSKIRFQSMDLKQKEKQDSWQSFISGKGSKKKTGFMTGHKKESIFKVPEGSNAKVGVVGSGRGMTDYQKRRRHDGLADDDE